MARNKALNNLLYFYLESGCNNLKMFAQKYGLSYNTLTEQIRKNVEPTDETIRFWCQKFHVDRTYFEHERRELTQKDLHYWHPAEVRYTLGEVYDAIGYAAEGIHIDRDAFESYLSEHHH